MNLTEKYESIINQILENEFAIIDGLFESENLTRLRNEVIKKDKTHQLSQAKIGKSDKRIHDNSVRTDDILWIENNSNIEDEQSYIKAVEQFYTYLNNACFTGISEFECHYARYGAGTFYKTHIDRFKNDSGRKFSLITYLNDSWKKDDGGELKLHLENELILIEPIFARTIIFKSHLIKHEVLLSNTNRYSLTGWLK